ncbi:meteorin-like protein [Tubulanus polymorphus]|uniref:meteorin-like protein n=1 Tax=Tubulanus polymorphus TaxID=672921 RepID=UPI003DA3270B
MRCLDHANTYNMGPAVISSSIHCQFVTIVIIAILFNWTILVDSRDTQCYWKIYDYEDTRGVKIIDVGCPEGRIDWFGLEGALRMRFRLPDVSAKLKACFRMRASSVRAMVSRETNNGLRALAILDAVTNEQVTVETCLNVVGEDGLVLFAEAPKSESPIGSLIIDYDLTSIISEDDMEECRPCTDNEMLLAFCTSDFVFRGEMESVKDIPEISHTEVNVKVNKLYRQPFIKQPFKTSANHPKIYNGSVYTPTKCHVMYGEGEFLFTGKIRFGRPILQCAPQWEQWVQLRSDAVRNGAYMCLLQ